MTMPRGHTGTTSHGNTRDVRVEHLGHVTIYKRGKSFYLYHRESSKSVRRRVDGNLATARLVASQVNTALEECRPSPLGFQRIDAEHLVTGFLDYCEHVAGHAIRTIDRYRAALKLFKDFTAVQGIPSIDRVTEVSVEEFVKWLRTQRRTRNGAVVGKQAPYSVAGIKFILSTCRTAINWARKRRYLPPYSENPFSVFPLEKLRDRAKSESQSLPTQGQAEAFFRACDEWQRPIFLVLAVYGMRVGELVHLVIEDVDLEGDVISVRSKPEMLWHVKTSRERVLPIFPEIKPLFQAAIGSRKTGFVFLERRFAEGKDSPAVIFSNPVVLKEHLRHLAEEARASSAGHEKDVRKVVTALLRSLGQIPEKRVRQEFMKITKRIGCPWLTRAHSLRHFFATQAQEMGMNPLLVQGILGHTSLDMTARYTHLSLESKRQALRQMFNQTELHKVVKPA
jgi:integrase